MHTIMLSLFTLGGVDEREKDFTVEIFFKEHCSKFNFPHYVINDA